MAHVLFVCRQNAGRSQMSQALFNRELAEPADVLVTMGCGDQCPYIPGQRYIDWDLPDPNDQPVVQVRAIRDEIDVRVRELVAELDAAVPSSG